MSSAMLLLPLNPIHLALHSVVIFTTAIYEQGRIRIRISSNCNSCIYSGELCGDSIQTQLIDSEFYETNEPEPTPLLDYFQILVKIYNQFLSF